MERMNGITVNKISINVQDGMMSIDYKSVTAIQYNKVLSKYRVLIYVKGREQPFDFTFEEKDLEELLAKLGLPELEKENEDNDAT